MVSVATYSPQKTTPPLSFRSKGPQARGLLAVEVQRTRRTNLTITCCFRAAVLEWIGHGRPCADVMAVVGSVTRIV
jgi:hypothetical protein